MGDTSLVEALYLHVPFCVRKCAYCDFQSSATRFDDPLMEAYVDALVAQAAGLRDCGVMADPMCAYVGGGTPSMLGPDLLARLVSCAHATSELTFEANPDSLTKDVLDRAVEAGATRVSVGVQSLCDRELRALGRIHTADGARRALALALGSGLAVSCDLMCAIPEQTDSSWVRTLSEVVAMGLGHVSVYPLALEEGTRLYERYAQENAPFMDEDVQAGRLETAERILTSQGLSRYEVASYAREGQRCRHNMCYWSGVDYLGLGTSAASMLGRDAYELVRGCCPQLPAVADEVVRVRLRVSSTARAIARDPAPESLRFDLELLDERQALAEDLMLAARMSSGFPEVLLKDYPDTERWLIERGLVRLHKDRLVPTHEGWLLGNELYGALWDLAGHPVVEASC